MEDTGYKPYFEFLEKQALFIAEAKSWEGTPYQHLGKTKGGGVDCAHFVGKVLFDLLVISKIEDDLYYAKDWYIHSKYEMLLEGIERHIRNYGNGKLKPFLYNFSPGMELLPGDILCMHLAENDPPFHHSGFYLGSHTNELIHALEATGVTREQFVNDWPKRTGKIYRIMTV